MQIDPIGKNQRNLFTSQLRMLHRTEHELFLRFDDCVFLVETNSAELHEKLKAYFNEFVAPPDNPSIVITVHDAPAPDLPLALRIKPPDPGKTKIKEEYADIDGGRVVRKRLTGMMFIFGGGDNLAIGPCVENDNQIINFINNRYIEWRLNQGGLLAHAAGVAVQGVGLAIAGFSGMGKSTLALEMLGLWTDFVSNDRLIIKDVKEDVVMFGVAKHPRINPGTILNNRYMEGLLTDKQREAYQRMTPGDLWVLEQKFDAPIDKYYGKNRFVLNARMKGLVILNWRRTDEPISIQPVDIRERKDLLPAFMKETGLFFQHKNGMKISSPSPEAYADLVSRNPVFEITGGVHFNLAARFFRDYLMSCLVS